MTTDLTGRKAGAASVDPDDFNATVDAVQELQAGGSTGTTDIPIADTTSITVDTTTYDNPVAAGKLTTLVFPANTVAFAFAVEGDDFPRVLFNSDGAGGGISLGDGTFDAYASGSGIYDNSPNGMGLLQAGGVPTAAPQIRQLTSWTTIISGTMPAIGAWVSGTAKQNPTTSPGRQIVVCLEIVTDGTANAATCTVAVSADNSTYTTIATPGASVAVNTVGAITMLASVILPKGWWIKLTLSHCTVSSSRYY